LSASQLKTLDSILATAADMASFHVSPFSAGDLEVIRTLLRWPSDSVVAVLDLVRILMLHSAATNLLGSDQGVRDLLLSHATSATNNFLVLRILTNWTAKRSRHQSERSKPAFIPEDIRQYIQSTLERLADSASSDNKSVVESYVFFVHNVVTWFCKLQVGDNDVYAMIASGLVEVLSKPQSDKVTFYASLSLGSLGYGHAESKDMIADTFADALAKMIEAALASTNDAIRQVGEDLRKLFSRKHS